VPRATGTPGFFGDDGLEKERGNDAAEDLRGPVEKLPSPVPMPLGDPETDADGGVEVAAGNVVRAQRPMMAHGQARGQSDPEKADAAGALQVAIRADPAPAPRKRARRCR